MSICIIRLADDRTPEPMVLFNHDPPTSRVLTARRKTDVRPKNISKNVSMQDILLWSLRLVCRGILMYVYALMIARLLWHRLLSLLANPGGEINLRGGGPGGKYETVLCIANVYLAPQGDEAR
eukprot:Hpha_TRINITY_DN35801_c0_g1::TRINITY_DN35801_c0_g1_i1::g.84896::m.84896